ncbi:hypothetical protein DMH01_01985 [Amycolatopsis sp. WAC 04182]|uniref:hypothetical protein n=1 Tax=Amycolatopsis sp. WAC 04182 TaxID=2203198 RepID=UPI000F798542|nr:hypothetical protein [Amycolatopsis sp. WAC 04182]RSN65191.1 hypothetical protein DMH01_01985 [Amycolatopsis sp. WAC 04182]
MSGDEINGDTDAMREFASRIMSSLDTPPVSNISRLDDQATPCPGGLDSLCMHLTAAENATIRQLQTFITQAEQGFAAYSAFVQQTAASYLRADETARQEILNTFVSQRPEGLPVIDPRLVAPRAGQH